jgi:hypothetical protein
VKDLGIKFFLDFGYRSFLYHKYQLLYKNIIMYSNYSTTLKLVIIALVLISSISLSLNSSSTPQIINKLAFAQQNTVLPNYKGNYRPIEPSNVANNNANPAFSEIQPNSLLHYQPITPTSHYYTGNPNGASVQSFPILTANMINSTNLSGIVQPVSLVKYQPITPAGLQYPITSTNSAGLEHVSINDDNEGSHHSSNDNSHDGGSHHSSNDNSHDGGSHFSSTHHKSSSNHDDSDHGKGTRSHHSSHHSGSNHHGASASASASAGSGGASASASAG